MSPVLELRGLCKSYRSAEERIDALAGIDLTVAGGESLAVVGPSGSGKSTLLACLAGLEAPDAGRVLVEGRDLGAMSPGELAAFRGRRMGFVFQSYRLLSGLTAEENVRVPLELAGVPDAAERARRWLQRVGLERRASHQPTRLSGGEQQRVAIARALVGEPALLLADEPTGNLDEQTGDAMAELLFDLAAADGRTLVYVTHDRRLAARAGRRCLLQGGRLHEIDGDAAAVAAEEEAES